MSESLRQLRAEFLAETEERLEQLQRDLNALASGVGAGGCDPEVVDRVFRTTHSLKGVAGMFGLHALSAVAHAMENALEELRAGTLAVDAALADLLHRGLDALHALRARAAADLEPGDESSWRGLVAALGAHVAARRRSAEPPAAPPADEATLPIDDAVRETLTEARERGRTLALVTAGSGGDVVAIRAAIGTWGEVLASVPVAGRADCEARGIAWIAAGAGELFALMRAVGPLGADVRSFRGPGAGGVRPTSPQAGPARRTVPESGPEGPGTPAETLRVPVDRVDRLLAGLGDLLQASQTLDATVREVLDWVPDRGRRTGLIQGLRHLDRRLHVLQDEILRIRMISLDPLFQRLERTLREAARTTGHEARLVARGGELELDKRVVDALAEPLVHLVRNAVDHGLETPDARRARGRPPVGTVEVAARRDGSRTVLEVADDGAGIDWDAVRARAVARGLLADGARVDHDALVALLFHPGFSLRDRVTEISGRGVGLDAVRESVARLGGVLEVEADDRGTTFRLRIPTTLAIARSLLVEAGGESFFLPLGSVARVDLVPVDRIESAAGREAITLGERVVPVRDLGRALGLEPVRRDRDRIPAVVLGIAERRLVLLVDRLAGQREIVTRSLGDGLPPVPGIAGSAEIGDGRTVLVLDPGALLEPLGFPASAAGDAA